MALSGSLSTKAHWFSGCLMIRSLEIKESWNKRPPNIWWGLPNLFYLAKRVSSGTSSLERLDWVSVPESTEKEFILGCSMFLTSSVSSIFNFTLFDHGDLPFHEAELEVTTELYTTGSQFTSVSLFVFLPYPIKWQVIAASLLCLEHL